MHALNKLAHIKASAAFALEASQAIRSLCRLLPGAGKAVAVCMLVFIVISMHTLAQQDEWIHLAEHVKQHSMLALCWSSVPHRCYLQQSLMPMLSCARLGLLLC